MVAEKTHNTYPAPGVQEGKTDRDSTWRDCSRGVKKREEPGSGCDPFQNVKDYITLETEISLAREENF